MNYFAHGRHFVDDPYFLAGTAVPDWLNVVDRRVRTRARAAAELVEDEDPRAGAVAQGIVQHHHDDDWFHRTAAFSELCWDFTVRIRDLLSPDDGLRPSFLGHILVELLLDAALITQHPRHLDVYYGALESLDPEVVQQTVNRIAARSTAGLRAFIPRFSRERFLYDYSDDAKLLFRLNQVMQRVKLPLLPDEFCQLLPAARRDVRESVHRLLADEGKRETNQPSLPP